MLNFLRSREISDVGIRIILREKESEAKNYEFFWKDFKLFDSSEKEVDLNTDIFNEE